MRPVTCFTPHPSSRSCCCRASSSTWLIPALDEPLIEPSIEWLIEWPDAIRIRCVRLCAMCPCVESLIVMLCDESDELDVPVCASAGAAQQQRAASAATERNVIATSRGVVLRNGAQPLANSN